VEGTEVDREIGIKIEEREGVLLVRKKVIKPETVKRVEEDLDLDLIQDPIGGDIVEEMILGLYQEIETEEDLEEEILETEDQDLQTSETEDNQEIQVTEEETIEVTQDQTHHLVKKVDRDLKKILKRDDQKIDLIVKIVKRVKVIEKVNKEVTQDQNILEVKIESKETILINK